MTTAIVCTALLGALLFVLSMRTSKHRGAAENQFPTSPSDPLFVAIRAHRNAAEHNPMLAILIVLVGSRDPAGWMVALMVIVTVARYLHALVIITAGDMAKHPPLRIVAAVVTCVGGLGLVAAALVVA